MNREFVLLAGRTIGTICVLIICFLISSAYVVVTSEIERTQWLEPIMGRGCMNILIGKIEDRNGDREISDERTKGRGTIRSNLYPHTAIKMKTLGSEK